MKFGWRGGGMRGQHAPSDLVVLTEGLDVLIPRTADVGGKEGPTW